MNDKSFYIASRLENADMVRRLAAVLTAAGYTHTYDWTTHGSVQDEGMERLESVAIKEVEGVIRANVVIVVLPGGRGTHTELGVAIGKPGGMERIIICAEDESFFQQDERTCVFYWLPGITCVTGQMDDWLCKIFAALA